jgi:peptidyl-prolyl cis-trans isomerase C
MPTFKIKNIFFAASLLALLLSACGQPIALGSSQTPSPTFTPTLPPTATLPPMALIVNGEGIPVTEFEAALARYHQAQTALGNTVEEKDAIQAVSQDLVDTLLLGQGAAAEGLSVDDPTVQAHIDALAAQVGGASALETWEISHGYTEADFFLDMKRQLAAALMRDTLTAAVPTSMEQVHVKQILLYNLDEAQQALDQLKAGADFNDLVVQYDPVTKGELGWFPRGYLPEAGIEEAAFALQPGQYSEVIQTQAGYHILFLVERDPDHPLSPDALLTLQQHAVTDWLAQQREKSTIVIEP